MVGVVLRVVVLDQQTRTLQPEVVAMPGPPSAGPAEGKAVQLLVGEVYVGLLATQLLGEPAEEHRDELAQPGALLVVHLGGGEAVRLPRYGATEVDVRLVAA